MNKFQEAAATIAAYERKFWPLYPAGDHGMPIKWDSEKIILRTKSWRGGEEIIDSVEFPSDLADCSLDQIREYIANERERRNREYAERVAQEKILLDKRAREKRLKEWEELNKEFGGNSDDRIPG